MRIMCGRFAFQGNQWPEIVSDVQKPLTEPNYNICPQDSTPVIHLVSGKASVSMMKWGLRPSWSKKSTMEPINARIESVESKPMFRDAYSQRKCLIPADGWYEWKTTPRGKVPFYHRQADQSLLLLAGIYEHWQGEENEYKSFSLLTTDATDDVSHVHDRMPVLIEKDSATSWLYQNQVKGPDSQLEVYPVGREVNKTTASGIGLIQRLRTLFD